MASLAARLAVVVLVACGGAPVREPMPGPPRLRLEADEARYEIVSRLAGVEGRGEADVAVRRAERDELVGRLTLRVGAGPSAGALAGLADISFHFRLAPDGRVLAAGGCSGASAVPLSTLARALDLWPLILAALPRLAVDAVEGSTWSAEQKTAVIGGGKELVAEVAGQWKLVRLMGQAPPTAVLEGRLEVSVRDLAADPEAPARTLALAASVYVNLERGGIDFVSVSGDGVAWSARRLSP